MLECGTARHVTPDNIIMTHAFCMLDDCCYKYTLRIYNAYCFFMAAVVA